MKRSDSSPVIGIVCHNKSNKKGLLFRKRHRIAKFTLQNTCCGNLSMYRKVRNCKQKFTTVAQRAVRLNVPIDCALERVVSLRDVLFDLELRDERERPLLETVKGRVIFFDDQVGAAEGAASLECSGKKMHCHNNAERLQ